MFFRKKSNKDMLETLTQIEKYLNSGATCKLP